MAEDFTPTTERDRYVAQNEMYIRPGGNLEIFAWMLLLGLPALMLFLIYSKQATHLAG
jgi:hypothetical protein